MFRLLFVMVTTILVGLGSGYFLWGSRVARLTESLSSLTLEIDTMRAKLASPRATDEVQGGGSKAADELHAINESIAAFRQELADQKALLEKSATAGPGDVTAIRGELQTARNDLAACIADKQDLELHSGTVPAPSPIPGTAPSYQVPRYRPPAPVQAPPSQAPPPAPRGLDDPRY